jgi:3-methyladenine DNA glycosylase AlkD
MEILKELRDELKSLGDPGRRASAQRYFREEISLHGVSSADVKRIESDYYSALKGMDKNYIFCLCEELWRSPYFEENIIHK